MFRAIYEFELKYNSGRLAPYIFLGVLALFSFLDASNTSTHISFISRHGQIAHNAPITIAKANLFLSVFGVLVTIVLAGTSVVRDFETRIHEFFFSAPISKMGYLCGRFLGGMTITLFIYIGVLAAYGIGCLVIDEQFVGPFNFAAFLLPYLVFVIPNLLFMGVLFFAFAVLTRQMITTYVISIAFLVIYFSVRSSIGDFENPTLKALLDPFGLSALEVVTRFWSVSELNTQLLPFDGLILWNRLLWLSITVGAFFFLLYKFRFLYEIESKQRKEAPESSEIEFKAIKPLPQLPVVQQVFEPVNNIRKTFNMAKVEFLRIVLHPAFLVLTVMAIMQAHNNFVDNAGANGSNVYPLTSWFLRWATVGLELYIIPLTIFFSGLLVWRERDACTDEIYDCLPIPNWVHFGSKLLAMMAIQSVFVVTLMITGVFAQGVIFGYTKFEFLLYFKALFGVNLLNYWHMAIVAILVQTLVANKNTGYFISASYFVIDALLYHGFHLTDFMSRFGLVPAYAYSNLNGFGHYSEPILWYRLYWMFFAIIIVIAANLLWRRGRETNLGLRLRVAKQSLTKGQLLMAILAASAFLSTGGFIYYNTHVLNSYLGSHASFEFQASYEKRYKKYENAAQPRITHVAVNVDIFPQERDAIIKGSYILKNKTAAPIDSIHVNLLPLRITEVNRLIFNHQSQLVYRDDELGYMIYELSEPLLPGETVTLEFDYAAITRGFTDNNPNNALVENGTYLDNIPNRPALYFPQIGYNSLMQLRNNQRRTEYGLPERVLPTAEDSLAKMTLLDDWVTFDATVSTSNDQIAIATGNLVESWTSGERNYYHYSVNEINNQFVILSGRYEVLRDEYKDITIEIYYHEDHQYNLARMVKGIKRAFDYCTSNFGPYPYRTVKVVEVPDYSVLGAGGTARSQPTVFTWNENGGFISNLEDENVIDVVFNTTTHEMAHQWWGHMVKAADVEGGNIMVETLAQWVRVMCLEKEYGVEKSRRFLKTEMQGYLSRRGSEISEERPLKRARPEQGYLSYNKGSVVMYALQNYIGEHAVNRALRNLVEQYRFKEAPYVTTEELIKELRAVTPDSFQYVITDLFEAITFYKNKAVAATYKEDDNGKYRVYLTVESKKLHADGKGNETEIPIDDYIDIGVFGEDERELYLRKHKITKPVTELEIIVDEIPKKAGIDPFIILIDKNREDNILSPIRIQIQ